MASASSNSPIEMFSSRYPFGRHRQQPQSVAPEPVPSAQCVLLKRQYHPTERQELLTKAKYHSQLCHGSLIGVLRWNDEPENGLLAAQFEYVASSLRDAFGILSEEELEHGRNSLYHLCSYLISNNINPEVAEELIGVDSYNQLKLFLDVDFRVLDVHQNRTELIRAKRAEINTIIDRHLAGCGAGCRPGNAARSLPNPMDTNYWLLGVQGVTKTCQLNTTFGCGGAFPTRGLSVMDSLKIRASGNAQRDLSTPKSQMRPSNRPKDSVLESNCNTRTLSGIINNYMQLPENSEKSKKTTSANKKLSTFAKYDKKVSGDSNNSRKSSAGGNMLPMDSRMGGRESQGSVYNCYELPMCSDVGEEDQKEREFAMNYGLYDEVNNQQKDQYKNQQEEVVAYSVSIQQCNETVGESDDTYKAELRDIDPNSLQVPTVSMRQTTGAKFYHSITKASQIDKKLSIRTSNLEVNLKGGDTKIVKQPDLPFSILPPEIKRISRESVAIPSSPVRNNLYFGSNSRPSCQINERVRQSLRKTEEAVARYSQFRRQ